MLVAGGLVCASATAIAELAPPPAARPARIDLAAGDEPGIDAVAEQLALAGYARVERVEERGQFAVRGGIVDVFPTTGREPLRIDFFGDEIEAIRAFSSFTQRALRPVGEAPIYPAAERRVDLSEPTLLDEGESPPIPDDLVPAFDRAPDLVFEPEEVGRVWDEESLDPVDLAGAALLDPFPRGQAHAFEAQRPAVAARGLAEAEQELASFVRAGQRVVVAFPHRGDALRTANLLRRLDAEWLEPGEELPDDAGPLLHGLAGAARLRLARPRARPAPRHADLPQARAARATPASAARSSRSPTCAPATTSSTRTTASASCSASRRRRSRASRATTSSSPSAARTASTSRTSRSARSRATSAPTRRRRRSPSSAARPGCCSRAARASRSRSSPAS